MRALSDGHSICLRHSRELALKTGVSGEAFDVKDFIIKPTNKEKAKGLHVSGATKPTHGSVILCSDDDDFSSDLITTEQPCCLIELKVIDIKHNMENTLT